MELNLLQKRLQDASAKLVKANARLNKWVAQVSDANKHLIGASWIAIRNAHLNFEQETALSEISRAQDIVNQTTALVAKYNEQVAKEVSAKDDLQDAPAIVEFLNAWLVRALDMYTKDAKEYASKKSEIFNAHANSNRKLFKELHDELVKQYAHVADYVYYYGLQGGLEKIAKDLESEKQRKAKNLIARIKDVVGKVVDAQGLYIANNAEINGEVIGEQGKAKVETITAGGYNIQCLHFRVLVHKI